MRSPSGVLIACPQCPGFGGFADLDFPTDDKQAILRLRPALPPFPDVSPPPPSYDTLRQSAVLGAMITRFCHIEKCRKQIGVFEEEDLFLGILLFLVFVGILLIAAVSGIAFAGYGIIWMFCGIMNVM
ncbi:hypothetical protein [Clostridium sp. AN503]|uniref:hypothetical protein n=1 Tax=Clostridium sp. AN503 TaxID=3160598 RepID=UPI0034576463